MPESNDERSCTNVLREEFHMPYYGSYDDNWDTQCLFVPCWTTPLLKEGREVNKRATIYTRLAPTVPLFGFPLATIVFFPSAAATCTFGIPMLLSCGVGMFFMVAVPMACCSDWKDGGPYCTCYNRIEVDDDTSTSSVDTVPPSRGVRGRVEVNYTNTSSVDADPPAAHTRIRRVNYGNTAPGSTFFSSVDTDRSIPTVVPMSENRI